MSVLNPRRTQGIDKRHIDLEVLQSGFSGRRHSERTAELGVGKLFG